MLMTLALEATVLARILMQNQPVQFHLAALSGLVRRIVPAEWVKTLSQIPLVLDVPERDNSELAVQALPMQRMMEWTRRQKPKLRDLLPRTNGNA